MSQNNYNNETSNNSTKHNALAIVGFIMSVVSLFRYGLILGPLGLIFSIIGLVQISKNASKGKGLAITGILIGLIMTILSIVAVISMNSLINNVSKEACCYNAGGTWRNNSCIGNDLVQSAYKKCIEN